MSGGRCHRHNIGISLNAAHSLCLVQTMAQVADARDARESRPGLNSGLPAALSGKDGKEK